MAKSKEYMALYRARGYGTDFESLTIVPSARGEVKVLIPTSGGQNKTPDATISKNRVYANVNKVTGHIKDLFFYDDEGKLAEQWNLGFEGSGHPHEGSLFHLHYGLSHKNGGRALTQEEIAFATEIDKKWTLFARQNSVTLRRRLISRQFNHSWLHSLTTT